MTAIDIFEIIRQIYDAPFSPDDGWERALEYLVTLFKGSTACFVRQDMDTLGGIARTHGTDPSFHQSYFDYYVRCNMLWSKVRPATPGQIFTEHDVMGKQAFLCSEFYNDWLRPQDVYATLACKLAGPSAGSFASVISVQRPQSSGDFGKHELETFRRLVPHLQRAAEMETRLSAAPRNLAADVVDHLREGVCLLGADAAICFANRRATELLDGGDGLMVLAGHLVTSRPSETAPLHRHIQQAASPSGASGFMRVSRPNGRRSLDALIVPLHKAGAGWQPAGTAAVVVFIADPEDAIVPCASQLERQFGLTKGEAAVALELLHGGGLPAIAERLGIARATAGTHLAGIFAKTGTHRQAELVRVLLQATHGIRSD